MPPQKPLFTPLDQPLYPSPTMGSTQPLFTPLDQPLYGTPQSTTPQQAPRPLNALESVVAGQPAQKPREMSWTDWFITNGLRTGGAIGGGMLGAGSGLFTAGATSIPGAMLGAGAGATAGDILARRWMGEEDNPAASITEGLVAGVTAPLGPARVGLGAGAKAVLGYGAKNAALGAGTETLALPFRIAADEGQWRLPTLSEGFSTASGGALFGGGLGLAHGAKTNYEPSLAWLSTPKTRAPDVAAKVNAALDARMNEPAGYSRDLPEYYSHPSDLPPGYQQPKSDLFGYHDLEAPDELPSLWRNEPGNPYGEDLPGMPTANNSLDKFLMQYGLTRNEFYSLPMDRQQAIWRQYDVWQGQGQQTIPNADQRPTPGYSSYLPSQQFTPPDPPSIVPPDSGGQGQRNLFNWEPPRAGGQMGLPLEPAEPQVPYDNSYQPELGFTHYSPMGGATGERTPIQDLRNQSLNSFRGQAGPIVGGPWQQSLGLSGIAEQTPYRTQMDPAALPPMSAFEPPPPVQPPPPVVEAPPIQQAPIVEPVRAADTPVAVPDVVVKPGETVAQLKWRTGIDWNAARALWAAAQVKAMEPVKTEGKAKKAPVATTPVVGKEMAHNHPFLAEDMTLAGDVATVHFPSAEINAWLKNNGFVPYPEGAPNQMIRQGGVPTKFIEPPPVVEKKKGTGSKFEQAMQARTGVPEGHVSVGAGEDIIVPNERAALKTFIDNMEKQSYRAFGKTPDGKSTIFRKFDPSEAAPPADTKTGTTPLERQQFPEPLKGETFNDYSARVKAMGFKQSGMMEFWSNHLQKLKAISANTVLPPPNSGETLKQYQARVRHLVPEDAPGMVVTTWNRAKKAAFNPVKSGDSEAGFIDFGQVGEAIGKVKRKLGVGMGNVPDKVVPKGEKKPLPTPNYAKEVLALPSAAVTTGDLSFSGRQGITQVFSRRFWKGVPKMLQALERGNYLTYQRELDNNPVHRKSFNPETGEWNPSLAERARVKRLSVASEAGPRAENIASKWIETGGFLGPETIFGVKNYPRALYSNTIGVPIRATNRAYITMANHLSTTMLEELADDMANISIEGLTTGRGHMPGVLGGVKLPEFMGGKRIGFKQDYTTEEAMNINPYTNDKAAQELGDFINTALGMAPKKLEGVPWKGWKWDFERASGVMNATMFSPGLFFSRLRMLTPGTYVMASPYIRKQYLKSALSMAAAWYAITNIMKVTSEATGMDDVEIVNDWTNADFGKVRVGDTRMDPGGGSLQFLVAFGRMMAGGWTSSSNQQFHEFGQGINARTQFSNAFEFMANKLNPVTKFALDIARASEYMPFHAGDRTLQLFTPLIVQDAIELAHEDPDLLPWLAPISLGLGTQTYNRGESEGKLLSPENDWLIQGNEGLKGFLPSSYSRVER